MAEKIPVDLEVKGLIHSTGLFETSDNIHLSYNAWLADTPQGILILVHGLGDHSGHMMTVVEKFESISYTVYGYDQRGHGNSPGKRGHIKDWKVLIDDLTRFIKFVQEKEGKSLPIFLFGNSMGGAEVLMYAMKTHDSGIKGKELLGHNDFLAHKLSIGVVANAPALALQDLGTTSGMLVGVASMVAPSVSLDASLDSAKLTRDPEKQKENDTDPLVHSEASMKMLNEIKKAGEWVVANYSQLQCPVLLLQGRADQITVPQVAFTLVENVQKTNKGARLYATDGVHETFNDTDRKEVLAEITKFVLEFAAQ